MELRLKSTDSGNDTRVIAVSDAVFATPFNESLIHQVITTYLTRARSGSKAQKTRAEVNASKNKPWRQKGTGRARAGSFTSPLWRGGGVIFAARPTNYHQKLNKKMYRGAFRSLLSEIIRQQRLVIVNNLTITSPKTKELLEQLGNLDLERVLIIVESYSRDLWLASRNLCNVQVCDIHSLNLLDLLRFGKVLVTVPALRKMEENLS
jgi:large subunit ribosomal protein L4